LIDGQVEYLDLQFHSYQDETDFGICTYSRLLKLRDTKHG